MASASNSTVARRPVLDGPADYLIVLLILLFVTITVGTWATGQIAGLITHAAWPSVSFGKAFAVAKQIPHHLDDPKQAWPEEVRKNLPGPVGFAVAASIVVCTMSVAAGAVIRRLRRNQSVRGFASPAQLAKTLSAKAVTKRGTIVRPSLKGRRFTADDVAVRLGWTMAGMLLWVCVENSVLMLAAPRQGKTSQVIIPWIRAWKGPMLVTSVRGDVLDATVLARRALGPSMAMVPTGMVEWPDRVQWSPTSGCADFGKAMQRADLMVKIGKSETTDSSGAGFFGATATSLLAGWLHAAAITGRSMEDVLRWGFNAHIEEPIKLLAESNRAEPGVAEMLDGLYRNPGDTRANLFATVQTALTPLFSPLARATFVPKAGEGIDIEDWLRSNGTVYLLVDKEEATALAPLITAFVSEVFGTAKRLADRAPGGRLDPPLGALLDEVANVSPLPNLPDLMSFAGGSGIYVVAVLQNMAQARKTWGREGAEMLWGSSTVKIALGGLGGDELEEFSKLAGVYRESLTTYQSGSHGTTMQTTLQDRKTVTPDEIRTLDEERREALVIHATTPIAKLRMQRHYESPDRAAYEESISWAREYRTETFGKEAA
ncbi:type IV secretory system conjugative DNA transfer family protein [Streptacidiphilus albus]|uniref:type IV secretory system conjugative DNA transfer family protein n=1 Tax=Streptacidiphilus albus TaxID=105425 RepID=UPI00054BC916|nr:TraM recognition domain-containing protein [Streptacidiphilus albus]